MAHKILIIDDDPDFVSATKMVLESGSYEVVEAYSGKEGLLKSKEEQPDLYIIDLMMETYSEGSNVIKALQEDPLTKDKPRILITALDLKGPWDNYPQNEWLGCEAVLQKPVSPPTLLELISRALKK